MVKIKIKLIKLLNSFFNFFGFSLIKKVNYPPVEFSEDELDILNYVFNSGTTGVSYEGLIHNIISAKYVINNNIKGDFVELGVWKGGSAIAVKLIFDLYKHDANVWLFDTYAGMTRPLEIDVKYVDGKKISGLNVFEQNKTGDEEVSNWNFASLSEVKENFNNANALDDKCKFIKGDVLVTVKEKINEINDISILRLDVDIYEPTKIGMELLYPKISKNGVLLLDDYGGWEGARKATDDYFLENKINPYLGYVDKNVRIAIKK